MKMIWQYCFLLSFLLPSLAATPVCATQSVAVSVQADEEAKKAPVQPRKIAYLTFDDGPNRYTRDILNILQQSHAPGTFFVVGTRITRYPEIMHRILKEGHYIGLHSMSHNVKALYNGNPATLIAEMEQERQIITATTGFDTRLVRVPYGSKPYLVDPYRDALVRSRFKLWDWTIDTNDWKRTSTSASIIQTIQARAHRDTEVILLHDSNLTVQTLPQIITYLRASGYTLLPYNPSSHTEVNFWHDVRL